MASRIDAVWKTVREIKVEDIRAAAAKTVTVALVGSEDELVWLQGHFYSDSVHPGDLRRAKNALKLLEAPLTEAALKCANECTFVCITPEAALSLLEQNQALTVPIYTIGNEGEWDHFKREIVDTRWDLHLALGRNLPGLRADVLEYIIVNVACVNAEIAVVSAIFTKFPPPGLGPIYPGLVFGDTVLLTKNQVMLAFKVAGACGLPVDIVQRKIEVVSIIGGGLGWRLAARFAAGLIPAAGWVVKGGMAYAGTYAVGKALVHLFTTGRRMGRTEEGKIFKEAAAAGRLRAAEIASRLSVKPAAFRRRGNRPANAPSTGAGQEID